jgi:methylated-DNA-[protein]-cysteine S-methyltransferase
MPMTASTTGAAAHTVIDSPVGPLTLVTTDGALSGLYMDEQRHRPDRASFGASEGALFGAIIDQLHEYFAGRRTQFELPIALNGTAFQRRVWAALQTIPYGRTVSYGELAAQIGQPGASRAVGMANGRNPIGIIVPCHRVVGSNGSLTGYGGGLQRKAQLLALERAQEQLFSLEPVDSVAGRDKGIAVTHATF